MNDPDLDKVDWTERNRVHRRDSRLAEVDRTGSEPRSAGGTPYTATATADNQFLAGRGSRSVADSEKTPPSCKYHVG